MELEITNTNNTKLNTEVDDFIKELKECADKKEITIENIKIDENSTLSLTNNIAKNNKMTDDSRKEFFLQERLSIFDIYSKNKRAGDVYYIASKGVDKDFYALKADNDYRNELVVSLAKSELPDGAKVGEIYRRKKDGKIYLSEDETKGHNEKMKEVAKDILNEQELNGGYKKGFTKNDLKLGKGYEGIYSGYQIYHYQKLGQEAELPPTMLEKFFKDDIKQIYEQNAIKLSESETIYIVFPDESKLYMFSNGKMKEAEPFNGLTSEWFGEDGRIFKLDKSGKLKEDTQSSKIFRDGILEDMKSTLKPKYDKICKDYKKTNHIYEVDKTWDENFIPTITLKDISENRYLELEDLDFIEHRYSGEGKYVVKDGEYYKINKAEEIPKNNTVDKEKEDEKNLSNIMAKKYDIPKETIVDMMKDFMIEASKDEGVVVYTGYDMKKDVYYRDYYMEGNFDERETISKEVADNMEVGTFLVMGRDELNNYYGFLSANELEEEFEEIIKLSLK